MKSKNMSKDVNFFKKGIFIFFVLCYNLHRKFFIALPK